MKILKSIGSLLIIACGAYVSYLAFLAYDLKNWTRTGIFLGAALLLLCFGIVTLLLTLTKKPSEELTLSASIEVKPFVAQESPIVAEELFDREDEPLQEVEEPVAETQPAEAEFTEETNSDEAANLEDILPHVFEHEEESELVEGMSEVAGQERSEIKAEEIEEPEPVTEPKTADVASPIEAPKPAAEPSPAEVANPIEEPEPVDDMKPIEIPKIDMVVEVIDEIEFPKFKVHMNQVEIKEDPKFLFGDWWVDENGLYIDMRLIGISGRKQQKALKKLALNTKLDYHVNNKNDAIEIVHNKVVLGLIPELYLHSLLMYIQGIENVKAESIVKKGRDVVQFIVKVRFADDLREKLQKKLQQKTWQ